MSNKYICNFQNADQGNQVQLTYVNIVFVSSCCFLVQRRPLKRGWASTEINCTWFPWGFEYSNAHALYQTA